MARRVLITGGAGFLGAHVADDLLRHGYVVRAMDALVPQVHGPARERPAYLDPEVELFEGDVRDPDAVRDALDGIDAVIHLAARVGAGPSMYELADYASTNTLGTAVLLEALIERPVQRLVVASSACVYGEGLYRDDAERPYERVQRTPAQLARGEWEPTAGGRPLVAAPTPETKAPDPGSPYAQTKWDQERTSLAIGAAYRIPTVALRLSNVYGPHQATTTAYGGVLAIFALRALDGHAPLVFEDGRQLRDFVHARDAAAACRLALTAGDGGVFNIGGGEPLALADAAARVARALGEELAPEITGQYRTGDIRHCVLDLGRARAVLGYEPAVALADGLADLAHWVADHKASTRAGALRDLLGLEETLA